MSLRDTIVRAAAIVLGVLALQLIADGLLNTLNRELYDSALRWQALRRPADEAPYVLVEIDDRSIEELGRFPWSRDRFADLLAKTTEGRASVVGFDVIFSEAATPEGDRAFAEAIADAGNVVLASSAALARPGEVTRESGAMGGLRVAERLLEPLPSLAQAAAGVGSVSILEDADGAMRRYPVVVQYQGSPYQSLAQIMGGGSDLGVGQTVPLSADGSILINYGSLSPASIARISFSDVLTLSRADALRLFADNVVLVAATYTGGVDVAPTPLATRTPASYSHIYALNTLVTGTYLSPLSGLVPFVLALIVIALLNGQITGLTPLQVFGVTLGGLAVVFAGSAVFFLWGRVVLEPSLPALAAVVFVAGYSGDQWWRDLSARRQAEAFLERFLGSRIRRRRLDETALDERAQRLDLSILSVRLADFGNSTRTMEAPELVEVVRRFHAETVGVIEEKGGTVDRLLSDGLVAYWGFPEAYDDSPARAVAASQEIRSRILSLNDELSHLFHTRLRVRMGVATGDAVLADVGAEGIADYTILGRFVSLADRLRETAPVDGVHLCAWTHDNAKADLPGRAFEQPVLEADGFDEPVGSYLLERPYHAWVDRERPKPFDAGGFGVRD